MNFYFQIFKQVIQKIRADLILIVPFTMFYFCFYTFSVISPLSLFTNESVNISNLLVIILLWIVELFIKCIVIMWDHLKSLKNAYHHVRTQFFKLIMALLITLTPIGLIFTLLLKESISSISFLQPLILILILFLIAPIIILNHFLPVIFLLKSISIQQGIQGIVTLFESKINQAIYYVIFVMLISTSAMMIVFMLNQVPLIGKSILVGIFQGGLATTMALFSLEVFRQLSNKKNKNNTNEIS